MRNSPESRHGRCFSERRSTILTSGTRLSTAAFRGAGEPWAHYVLRGWRSYVVTYSLSDDQISVQDLVRRVAQDKVAARADAIDRTAEYPQDIDRKSTRL